MTETEKNVKEEEKPALPNLAVLLKDFENAPSEVQVEKWKQEFGEIFVSGFSETELFVWHPVSRMTYVELKKLGMKQVATPEEQFTDLDFEEAVVKKCVLWASDEKALKNKGGSISTLAEQIMASSNFMAPAVASMLVMKL